MFNSSKVKVNMNPEAVKENDIKETIEKLGYKVV
ncbi:hypothetical protein [Paracerasibacillus soli]|uniref:HMA domain-containing protein n=2 Tax=Paracerasibacillus soli TaxID=480284 RepID=A0ABU5CVF0_9BACI|nr:hypothetical protein [Virgibacillus soli]MDY0410359.1 hypothetical protein [Virgibacillus soli]